MGHPAGTITNTYDYDAFGNLINSIGSTPNNYLFAGEAYDPALGLYYNRARYLNTTAGRFWSMDTEEGEDAGPLTLHKPGAPSKPGFGLGGVVGCEKNSVVPTGLAFPYPLSPSAKALGYVVPPLRGWSMHQARQSAVLSRAQILSSLRD